MSWDDEFKEISKKFGLPDSRIYLETLKWKEFCAQLTYETYKDVYNQLEKDIKNSKIIEIMKNGKFGRYVWKASGEAACCIHITRTLVDVLLQIINKTILEEEILEHKVTLSNVKNKLKDKSALKIIEKLKILEESEEFNYIRNLDNKLKHQNLVKTDYVQTNLINKNNTRKGLKFQSFKINYGPWETIFLGKFYTHDVEVLMNPEKFFFFETETNCPHPQLWIAFMKNFFVWEKLISS